MAGLPLVNSIIPGHATTAGAARFNSLFEKPRTNPDLSFADTPAIEAAPAPGSAPPLRIPETLVSLIEPRSKGDPELRPEKKAGKGYCTTSYQVMPEQTALPACNIFCLHTTSRALQITA